MRQQPLGHITKHSPDQYTMRWAPQHLWEQVAHVDPSVANPTVSEYTRKQARRHQQNVWIESASTVDKNADTNQQTVGCLLQSGSKA